MNLVRLAVRQPVTVAVGVLLILLAGVVALRRIPIQLTPNVEDTIVAVTTRWEGASPIEVEQEIVDPQEERLQGIANLRSITSESQQGVGTIRLEFGVETSKEAALREVSDKLREVPSYPENVDEPVIEASDPENRDYIAWIILRCGVPDFDVRTLQDFVEDRVKPILERVPGISEINVLGGREREVQVRYDPVALAAKGIAPAEFVESLRRQNRDVAAGELEESKADVRLRLAGQFARVADVEDTVIAQTPGGPVFVRDVADVVETYKEPRTFVRSLGSPVLAINAQKEVGANVMAVMEDLRTAVAGLNEPGGVLDARARKLGLEGSLRLDQVYDQTVYIDDALDLVRTNIWIGGALAVAVLVLFLRSVRTVGIVAVAIPISVVGAVVAMVAMGRTINVISLAGMAFAVGMVVDNAIVVLENVYRHVEMGKPPARAAVDGGREVFGAVLASTLTTVAVFVPILLVEEEAGQLFRDISLAIVAAVALSLLVSVTVIPASAARILRPRGGGGGDGKRRKVSPGRVPDAIAGLVHRLNGSVAARIGVVLLLAGASVAGTIWLVPPTDYLPQGNRNLVFGLLIPPPSYNLDQLTELGTRIEETVAPHWRAAETEPGTPEREEALEELSPVPTFDFAAGVPGEPVVPPPITNYFLVSFDGVMFHGGISEDPERVVDLQPLFQHATRAEVAPGVLAFAFQLPLFRLGGRTGSAIKINFVGEDLDDVAGAAEATFLELIGRYSPSAVQPDPSNFNVPTPELRLVPDRVRIAETGLSFEDVALAVQTLGDGAIIGDYRMEGDSIDLKVISRHALERGALDRVPQSPIATPRGGTVPVSSVTRQVRINAPEQINRVGRQRAITLQFTPPRGLALEQAVEEIGGILGEGRRRGTIPPDVDTSFTGSASKLAAVQAALLGDGTLVGTLGSSLVLALVVVYLLLCVLFQSFLRPLIIMLSVPLATLGGFAALRGVYAWSLVDRYLPVQQLDILTMLGFVILIGVVVNNAILIVHQSINFMRGTADATEGGEEALPPREAITEAVRTRVRPILMSTLTSVGGMTPLILMPGSGSELYRGLGSVVVGGLLVSTVFTLLLVPLLFSLVTDFQERMGWLAERRPAVAARTAAALALFLIALSPGCVSQEPAWPGLAERLQRDVVEGVRDGQLAVEEPPSRVRDVVGERMDELEELGGPTAWEDLDPDLGPDLFGREQEERSMTLAEALRLAAENNLGLRSTALGAEAEEESLTIEEAAFDPVFFADLIYEELEQPRPVPTIGNQPLGADQSASERYLVEGGLRALLHSGATVSAVTFGERFDNRTEGIQFDPDPAWRAGVGLEAVQPLLAGSGSEVTTANVRLAETRLERAREDVVARMLDVGALVELAYWDLREARARLLVQQDLAAAGEEVERVLAARRSFDAVPAQYADALATVEERRSDLVRARRLLRVASDDLKAMLDAEGVPLSDETLLVARDDFLFETPVPGLRAAVETALERRPELRSLLLEIEDADLRERVARNLRRPRLDLLARLDAIGEDDSFENSTESLATDDFVSATLGIAFELPVGNRAAAAEVRRARLEARRLLLRYEELLRVILLEVKQALRDVRTNRELLGASRDFRIAQTENLRALLLEEERRTSLTPEFLRLKFERQERLAQAQLEELQAQANLSRALASLRRALGTGAPLASE